MVFREAKLRTRLGGTCRGPRLLLVRMCIPHMRMRNKLCLVIMQDGLDVVAFWVVDKVRIIAGMVVARAKKTDTAAR